MGAATLKDLTWKEILDTYSCTECGRCQNACPAWNTGKPLSPKLLIMNLRDHVFEEGTKLLQAQADGTEHEPVPLNPNVVDDEVVWACTTCGACMQECPVDIEHIDHIVDMRRNLVMAESRFPQEAGLLLRNLENSSNPWGQSQSQRGRLGGGAGRPRAGAGRPGPRRPLLGGLRGLLRRPGQEDQPGRGHAAPGRRRGLRHPRARASCARATRPGGSATSTCSRRWPSRTSRRSARRRCGPSSRTAPTASTR